MGWMDWFMPKEVEPDNGLMTLQEALQKNKDATNESIRLNENERKRARDLIKLSESALKILEKEQKE